MIEHYFDVNDYLDSWKLLAGLGLFLFGMHLLELSLKNLAGKGFRKFLRHSTEQPIYSVFGGIIATTIVQSSSLVGLIVLAFVGADIIPLVNAIGVLIGSNLGTTFTGWIVATLGFKLNFSSFIYPLLAVGGLSYGLLNNKAKNYSQLIIGFALLLMGLDFMKDSVSELTQRANFDIISGYPLIVYLLVGTLFTAIIQSSSAAMMLTLSALYAEVISLPVAAALVIGADLGTTSTVFLGSLQGAVAKRRLAMAHVLFNFSVDTAAFILLYPMLAFISWMQLTDPLYSLVAFHSLFNLLGLILFFPFINLFARQLEQWFPEQEQIISQYIHNVPLDVTDAALEALSKETRHLLYLVTHLNFRFLDAKPKIINQLITEFNLPEWLTSTGKLQEYMAIKGLEGEIIHYAFKIKIEESELSSQQSEFFAHKVDNLINAARYGVNSGKAFKDIEQDLSSFQMVDNKIFSDYFDELKSSAILNHLSIIAIISKMSDKNSLEDELVVMEENLEHFHSGIVTSIYSKNRKMKLSPVELSTLLNVNKEIETSAKALINSLRLI